MYITPKINLIRSQGQHQLSTVLHRLIPTLNSNNLLLSSSNTTLRIINNGSCGSLNTINNKYFYSTVSPSKK